MGCELRLEFGKPYLPPTSLNLGDGFYSRGKGELANALLLSAAGSSVRLQPDSSRRYTTPDSVASTNCSTVASPDSDESLETSSASSCDSDIVLPEQRQNPRRTSLSRGITPPSFQRCDKGHKVFIEGLLAVTTSFVEAIWPLSRETPRSSTDFNGAGVLPLRTFIQETCRRSRTSYSTLQIALYYLVLLKGVLPDLDFTREQPRESDIADIVPRDPHVLLGQPRGPSGCRVMQCGRRMFMSALMLAAKYLQDRNFSVKAWAKISGLSCLEINKNEKAYLQSIEYRLHLKKEHFENWSQIVVELCHSEKNKRSLDYLKIIRRLKPEIIHDPENTKHFLKEVGEGRYHAVSPSGGCSRPCWRTCKDDNNYPGPQIMHTPSMSLHPVLHKAAGLALGIGESTHHDYHIPVANIYSCPPPRPGYTSMSTIFREHIVSPPWSLSARSTESSSSSPESALGSVFSDNAEIVSRSRSSSISSAASFGSLQSFRLEAKATPYPSPLRRSIITAANNPDAGNADFKGRTLVTDQPSHLNVTPNRSQTLVGCAKRKACSAPMSSENAAATLVILSKHREQHSIISAAEDKTMSSKKSSKKRGPIKGLKAGHTSESVKAKRQLQRETLRMVKSGHPLPDGFPNDSLPHSDYPHRRQSDDNWSSSEETEVGEEEKENQVGHKTWAESRKPVLALHNPKELQALIHEIRT